MDYLYYFVLFSLTIAVIVVYFFQSLFLFLLRYIFKTQFQIDLDVRSYWSKTISVSCPQLGLNIKIEHFGLSSKWFNSKYNSLIALKLSDIRLEGDIVAAVKCLQKVVKKRRRQLNSGPNGPGEGEDGGDNGGGLAPTSLLSAFLTRKLVSLVRGLVLPLFAILSSKLSSNFQVSLHNTSLMQLGLSSDSATRLNDCLLHSTIQLIQIAFSTKYNGQLLFQVDGFSVKVFKSSSSSSSTTTASHHHQHEAEHSTTTTTAGDKTCLAQMSFPFHFNYLIEEKSIDMVIQDLEIIIYDLLQLLSLLPSGGGRHQKQRPQKNMAESSATKKYKVLEQFLLLFPSLLQRQLLCDISFRLSCLSIKLVREFGKKELTLGVQPIELRLRKLDSSRLDTRLLIENFRIQDSEAIIDFALAKCAASGKIELNSVSERLQFLLALEITSSSLSINNAMIHSWFTYFLHLVKNVKRSSKHQKQEQGISDDLITTATSSDGLDQPVSLHQIIARHITKLSVQLDINDTSLTMKHLEGEGEAMNVKMVTYGLKHLHTLCVHNLDEYFKETSIEFVVETLWCWNGNKNVRPSNPNSLKKYNEKHVPLFMSNLILKFGNMNSSDLRINCVMDGLQVSAEYFLSQLESFDFDFFSSGGGGGGGGGVPFPTVKSPKTSEAAAGYNSVLAQINFTSVNLFTSQLMVRIDSTAIDLNGRKLSCSTNGFAINSMYAPSATLACLKASELTQHRIVYFSVMRINFSQEADKVNREISLSLTEEIYLQWSPSFHQTVEDLREDLSRITAKMMLSLGRGGSGGGGGEEKLATSAAADSAQTTKFSGFNLSLKLDGKINLGILLSNEGDTMRFETEYFVLSLQNMRHISSKCELLSIYFNDVQSCCVEQLLIRHLTEAKNPVDRKIFKLMEQERNSAIEVTIHKVSLNFPYQFDFAYYFNEKFMSIVKWLRLSYSKEGRLARYLKEESPCSTAMAADFILKIGHILIEVGDDPFEVRLSDNYILMEDEYKESQLRWAIARQKIEENIKKPFSALSESKVAELRASFDRQTADTYMKRSKRLYETGAAAGATRTALFTAKAEELTLHLAADTSYNTYEKMVAILRAIDQASPYPEDLRFSTIWCRQIVLALGKVLVSLRDFPQPMLNAREINLRGILLGAEQEASARARRTCLIDMGPAFERVAIERSMTTLKFYHDISSKVGSLIYTHGACWEPILQQVNLSFEKIFRPSTDPSPTLPWWDKMRFLFHGALHVVSDQIAIVFHASLDPYNSTELIEISFLGAAVQLLTGKIVAGADLEVLVHTASKYDECRIVHLPDINVAFLLNWGCSGNRYDHHSVMPCARDKLPEYTCNQVHDSYRAFRSHHLNLSASIETKEGRQTQQTSAEGDEQQQPPASPPLPPLPLPEEKTPSVLLYNSTLRWLENKMFMITGFPRLTRRGKLYNNVRPRKMPFTRLFKSIRLTIYLQRLDVSYWSSYSKSRGFRISSCNLTHSAEHRQTFVKINDGLVHRPKPSWELIYMNSELSSVEITLYKVDAAAASTGGPGGPGGGEREDEAARFFFLKLHKVSYNRETKVPPHVAAAMALEEEEQAPIHRLIVHDLKGAWTKDNRDIVLTLFDSYFKTQLLKRNLSTEALRLFKDQLGGGGGGGGSPSKPGGQFEKNSSPYGSGGGHHQQHSSHHLSKGNAANMLQKLIAEVESESNVADTEQIENGVGSDQPMLYGIEACCQTHDLLLNNWLIELINSQVVLRGCETDGYVIVSAAKTSVTQRIHRPVWKNRVLYSKTTWQGSLECMQYYATVDAGGLRIDDITWLNLDDIEEQGGEEEEEVASGRKNIVENPDTVMGSGRSVGGVVNSEAGGCSTTASSAGNGSLPGINEPPSVVVKVPIQMQRIVSRCRCQFFYASYGENTDPSCYEEVPPLPADDLLPLEPWDKEVAVDTFTLTHEHLEISTNSQQFAMIMDLVNNLLLYVPHKKEVFEKQQRIRFSMQLNSLEDQRGPISELQDKVRLLLTRIKALEKEDYYMRKNHHGGGGSSAGTGGGGSLGNSGGTIGGGGGKKPSSSKLSSMMATSDDPESAKLAASLKETEWELHQCKEELARVGDDLSIMINCYKEAQLIASKTKERQVAAQESRDLLAQVVRRNEVCFKQASWRLTDIDGQLMLCDMVLQNFLYTKVSKNDDSVQHSFELGYVSVKNQMPNQVYREVLQPTELQPNMPVDQHRALRIICIEKAPVGGISVKEHLEVNVIPLTVGLTYAFFMKMLKFFFPERSTSLQEQQQQQQVSSTVTSTTGVGSSSAGNAPSAFGSSTVGSMAGDSGFDSLSGVGADDTISSAGSISTITSVSSSSKGEKAGKKGKGASAAAMKKEESTLSLASSLSSYNFKSSSKSNPTTSFQHIEKMRERASKNQTFVFIKIPEVPIRISYKGNKNKNLEDLRDVNLILPTFEYHNRTWTWLDLLMALKNDSKRVLLSQALKHKFHISKSKPQQLLSSALLSSSSSSSSSASAAAADAEKQQQQQQSALQQGSNSGGSGNGGSQSVVKSSEDEDKVRILLGKIVVPQKTTKSKSLLLFGKK